jgi:hypothetical protein
MYGASAVIGAIGSLALLITGKTGPEYDLGFGIFATVCSSAKAILSYRQIKDYSELPEAYKNWIEMDFSKYGDGPILMRYKQF